MPGGTLKLARLVRRLVAMLDHVAMVMIVVVVVVVVCCCCYGGG